MIRNSDRILILSHQKPDGDTLGSGFALLYALQDMGRRRVIECSMDRLPAALGFLYPGFDPVSRDPFDRN
jgi:phosphoesterase RecJ-like protein